MITQIEGAPQQCNPTDKIRNSPPFFSSAGNFAKKRSKNNQNGLISSSPLPQYQHSKITSKKSTKQSEINMKDMSNKKLYSSNNKFSIGNSQNIESLKQKIQFLTQKLNEKQVKLQKYKSALTLKNQKQKQLQDAYQKIISQLNEQKYRQFEKSHETIKNLIKELQQKDNVIYNMSLKIEEYEFCLRQGKSKDVHNIFTEFDHSKNSIQKVEQVSQIKDETVFQSMRSAEKSKKEEEWYSLDSHTIQKLDRKSEANQQKVSSFYGYPSLSLQNFDEDEWKSINSSKIDNSLRISNHHKSNKKQHQLEDAFSMRFSQISSVKNEKSRIQIESEKQFYEFINKEEKNQSEIINQLKNKILELKKQLSQQKKKCEKQKQSLSSKYLEELKKKEQILDSMKSQLKIQSQKSSEQRRFSKIFNKQFLKFDREMDQSSHLSLQQMKIKLKKYQKLINDQYLYIHELETVKKAQQQMQSEVKQKYQDLINNNEKLQSQLIEFKRRVSHHSDDVLQSQVKSYSIFKSKLESKNKVLVSIDSQTDPFIICMTVDERQKLLSAKDFYFQLLLDIFSFLKDQLSPTSQKAMWDDIFSKSDDAISLKVHQNLIKIKKHYDELVESSQPYKIYIEENQNKSGHSETQQLIEVLQQENINYKKTIDLQSQKLQQCKTQLSQKQLVINNFQQKIEDLCNQMKSLQEQIESNSMADPRTNSSDKKFHRRDPQEQSNGQNFYQYSDKKEFNNLYVNRDEEITKLRQELSKVLQENKQFRKKLYSKKKVFYLEH